MMSPVGANGPDRRRRLMRDLMERKVEASLLNGYYGALLTETQSEMLRLYCDEDLSLTEIAQQYHVSRQSVYDTLNRAMQFLSQTESKLHLLQAAERRQKRLRKLQTMILALPGDGQTGEAREKILAALEKLMGEEDQNGI